MASNMRGQLACFRRNPGQASSRQVSTSWSPAITCVKNSDPITNDDFDVLAPMLAAGGAARRRWRTGIWSAAQSGNQPAVVGSAPSGQGYIATPQSGSAGAVGGIVGVASKEQGCVAARVRNSRTHYNEWQFIYMPQTTPTAPGAAPGGPGATATRRSVTIGHPGGVGGQGERAGPWARARTGGVVNRPVVRTLAAGAAPTTTHRSVGSPFAPRRLRRSLALSAVPARASLRSREPFVERAHTLHVV